MEEKERKKIVGAMALVGKAMWKGWPEKHRQTHGNKRKSKVYDTGEDEAVGLCRNLHLMASIFCSEMANNVIS